MKKYIATSPAGLSFPVGTELQLAPDFAARVAARLKPVEGADNVYTVTGQLMLKRGTEFGYAGDLPKALVDQVEDPDKPAELALEPARPNKKSRR